MMRLNRANAHMWNDRMLGLAMTIRGLPIPVIAMVNGWCMGGGNELVLWCDVVIASENAVFGQTGAKVGACPTVGATQYLPRSIGERLAREMIFLARTFTAREALEIGLINKVVASGELRAATRQWCETIKGHSPQTLRATKKSLNHESDELYASWQHGMELLANVASNHLASGLDAGRFGNGHPNIVPYRSYATRAGALALAVGNDAQFARLAAAVAHPEWAADPRLATNAARVVNREVVDRLVQEALGGESAEAWIARLRSAGVPCGRVSTV
ncbi:MAG: CoA transferase, partial [Candidatus Rokubacteria bacterium]|nr:CoA transferase [Candidatus Rokubacteria bacterium]